jgi:hypothetical protein
MVSNQSWGEERSNKQQKGMHTVNEEADMLVAKMDLLFKRMDEWAMKATVQAMDSHMTCEVYREVGHSGNDYPETREDTTYINNGF